MEDFIRKQMASHSDKWDCWWVLKVQDLALDEGDTWKIFLSQPY